jgi:tRNA(Ile)-lysidine synthetase-like protein
MEHASKALDFLFSQLEKEFLFKTQPGKTEFNLEQIIVHPMAEFFMVELLLRNGFSFPDSEELALRRKSTESVFRENALGGRIEIRFPRLIIFDVAPSIFTEIEIPQASNQSHDLPSGKILKTWTDNAGPKKLPAFSWMADLEKICFPIRLRSCAPGDKMAVFGMSGQKKKVSDLLSEAKLSPSEKAEICLAVDSKGQILWIPGLRHAEICRLPENFSGPVFCMELLLPEEN